MRTIALVSAVLCLSALAGCAGKSPGAATPATIVTTDPSILPQTPTTIDRYVQAIRPHMTIPVYSIDLVSCTSATADCSETLTAAGKEIAALGKDLDAVQHVGRAPDEVMSIFLELAEASLLAAQAIARADTDWPAAVQSVQAVTDALNKWRPYGA